MKGRFRGGEEEVKNNRRRKIVGRSVGISRVEGRVGDKKE